MLDHFKLTPWQIRELTDRQIVELYFHPRNEDTGAIEPVREQEAPTLEQSLLNVDLLAAKLRLTPENVADMKTALYRKFGVADDYIPL